MSPVRSASFLAILVAAACSAPPIVGEYEGSPPTGTAVAKDTGVPAELELRADGSCLWHPAMEHPGRSYFIALGSWNVDSTPRGSDVVVVHPDRNHPERSLRFDVTTADGDTVLIATDGSRLVRKS